MLLAGGRGGTRAPDQPRVVQLQISRPRRALPRRQEPLEFVVAMHVEGTPVTMADVGAGSAIRHS